MATKTQLAGRLSVRDDVTECTYHRPATKSEVSFGNGGTHYRVYVTISSCSLADGMVGQDLWEHYRSEPMTPKQASKWLATLIRGKTAAAIQTRKCIPPQRGARFFIETPRGGEYSLIQFRQTFL